MADANNPGQFGNREDTSERASKGGQASTGRFGSKNGVDPHEARKKGVAAEPRDAKVKGGENSHQQAA